MRKKFTKMIPLLLASLALMIIFSGTTMAVPPSSCSGSTTIFSDNFGVNGDGTHCFSGSTAANMTLTANPRVNNGTGTPSDGEYSVICDGVLSGFDGFWLWHNTLTDHTADAAGDNGNMVIINDGDNNDFYKKNLTGLCVGGTYTVTFYLANLADLDVGGGCVTGLIPDISASAYNAGTTTGTTTNYGTAAMAAQSNLTWVSYSFSFTATQSSMDIVLSDLTGAGCGNDLTFDDFSVVGPPVSTPVELVSFTAEELSQNALLKWSTASERNVSYFSIEKSEGGINFSETSKVNSRGSASTLTSYEFLDFDFHSTSYYRLKMVDLDGSSKYSNVVFLSGINRYCKVFKKESGELEIRVNSHQSSSIKVLVYSIIGQKYVEDEIDLSGGTNVIVKNFNLSDKNVLIRIITSDGDILFSDIVSLF